MEICSVGLECLSVVYRYRFIVHILHACKFNGSSGPNRPSLLLGTRTPCQNRSVSGILCRRVMLQLLVPSLL
jgi:hypothetical protein